MQDPLTAAFQGPIGQRHPHDQQQQQQQLKCPRCESTNTKFCYYNNYNLSQPRHFCKNCRRYWTKGGSLRNVPVGGGSRKSSAKRSSSSSDPPNPPKRPSAASSPSPPSDPQIPKPELAAAYPDDRMLDINDGSFSSLLGFGSLFHPEGPPANPSRPMDGASGENSGSGGDDNPPPAPLPENFLDSGCWAGGWPDLAIYTPGSSFP